jgi:hypothetical protein
VFLSLRLRRLPKLSLLPFTLLAPVCALVAEPPSSTLLVWHFEQGITNGWGGQYNAFLREPSWARTYLDPTVTRSSSGHSLRVTAHREAEGFCGLWMDFYPESEVPRRYLDARAYHYLSFWIKGQKGGESFDLELTDEAGVDNEESRPRRPLRAYLPRGVTTQWQEVVIPLIDFHGLDRRRLVRMSLSIIKLGDYRFYLDDIAFKRVKTAVVPEPPGAGTAGAAKPVADSYRAMWVWNTRDLLAPDQPEHAKRFFTFCSENQVNEIYLSVEFDRRVAEGVPQYEIRNPERYRAILVRAHREGLRIEGLAGTPEWAVRRNHAHALAAVDAMLTFNRASPTGARFDGVHFDVEPYTLVGYSDPQYRPRILVAFLEMVSQCAARVQTEPNTRFSCDVPAWFYQAGGLERERLTVTFQGQEKTVGEHLTDLLESVTIMDYTNQADSAGGIIARGIPALNYAAAQGKKIVVGVETFLESDSSIFFPCGLPTDEFWRRLAASGLRDQLFFEDFRMSVFSDEVNVHIGLSAPREMNDTQRAAYESALLRLSRQLGAAGDPERYPVQPILEIARAAVAQDPELKGFETFEITDPETQRTVTGFRTVRRMSPRITFHGLGREVFEEESHSAVEWLSSRPSFAGLAIHFYDSFRELLEGK